MVRRRLHHRLSYFTSSLASVFGIVLLWRGAWYAVDWIDRTFFPGFEWLTVPISAVIGFLILYLPDKNLSELRKL